MCRHSGVTVEREHLRPGEAGREEPLASDFLVRKVWRISQEDPTSPNPAAEPVGLASLVLAYRVGSWESWRGQTLEQPELSSVQPCVHQD